MSLVKKEYESKLDNKKRLTIRGSKYRYYKIKEFEDGHLELEPRVLVSPDEISENTLKMMDQSVENIKKGKTSEKIKVS
jgi:hypothetical protein